MRTYDNVVASSERFIELAREQAKLHLVEEMVFEKCLASAASYVNPKKGFLSIRSQTLSFPT